MSSHIVMFVLATLHNVGRFQIRRTQLQQALDRLAYSLDLIVIKDHKPGIENDYTRGCHVHPSWVVALNCTTYPASGRISLPPLLMLKTFC